LNILELCKDKRVYSIHHSDLDGVGSFIVSSYYIKSIASEYYFLISSDRDFADLDWYAIENSDIIIFSDIAPKLEFLEKLLFLKKEVVICDHHISSYNELMNSSLDKENYIFNVDKCGTRILFEELTKNRRVKKVVFQAVELIDVYDRYETNSSLWRDAKDLHNVLYGSVDWKKNYGDNKKYEKFIENQLYKFDNHKIFFLTDHEKELAKKAEQKEKDNMQLAKKSLSKRKDNSGNIYAYFECSSKLSFVAMNLLKEYTDINYFVGHSTWLENAKGEINGKISLRSQEGFDVSVIAEKWNGGGHLQAAGLELPIDTFHKFREGKVHLI